MVRSIGTLLFAAVIAALAVSSSPCVDAKVVNHDSIPVWAEPQPRTNDQRLAVRFKPQIAVINGCHPYPAVDGAGNTSGGLKPSGAPSAACKDHSKGQVYARTGTHNGFYAIMYAWYMPKDSPSTGMGHRHDWENIVVWLDNAASAKIVAITASAHSGYKKSFPVDRNFLAGESAKISYQASWPTNHELGFTGKGGDKLPLIQWDQLTPAAQRGLETANFGSATVPFKSNFQGKLAKAFFK